MKKNQDAFVLKYNQDVKKCALSLSIEMSQGETQYKEKIKDLKDLVISGKTSSNVVDQINEQIMSQIKFLTDEHSKLNIVIKGLPQGSIADLGNSIITKIEESLKKEVNPLYFSEIIQIFKSEVEESLLSIFIKNNLITVDCDYKDQSLTPELVNEYIEKYISLKITPFSKKSIISYYNYLESKISYKDQNEDFKTLIIDKIKEALTEDISVLSTNLYQSNSKETLIIQIKNLIETLKDFENTDSEFYKFQVQIMKNNIKNQINTLVSQANKEVLPNLLEQKIHEIREKNRSIVNEISQCLYELEKQRDDLFSILEEKKLDYYENFITLKNVSNRDEAVAEILRISSLNPPSVMNDFIEKRNELSVIIRDQLDENVNDSYVNLKKRIKDLDKKNHNKDEISFIIGYFITSVDLLSDELTNSILGDLSLNRSEVLNLIDGVMEEYLNHIDKTYAEQSQEIFNDDVKKTLASMLHHLDFYKVIATKSVILSLLNNGLKEKIKDVVYENSDYSKGKDLFKRTWTLKTEINNSKTQELLEILNQVIDDLIKDYCSNNREDFIKSLKFELKITKEMEKFISDFKVKIKRDGSGYSKDLIDGGISIVSGSESKVLESLIQPENTVELAVEVTNIGNHVYQSAKAMAISKMGASALSITIGASVIIPAITVGVISGLLKRSSNSKDELVNSLFDLIFKEVSNNIVTKD